MMPNARPFVGKDEIEAIARVMNSGWLGTGPVTKQFEEALKEMLKCDQVIAVSSGTAALHLALMSFGIGVGDEVIVPSMTFCASVQPILATGATPVFADIDPDTLCIDVNDLAQRITQKTKAIMPVHYGGQPCEMDVIMDIAQRCSLYVIEDAAHAFGSTYKGRTIGVIGHATCFSFDPIKNITCGEGGAIALSNSNISEKAMRMRLLGMDQDGYSRSKSLEGVYTYTVTDLGYRYHLSDINAAIGMQQLAKFTFITKRRREIWQRYSLVFQGWPELKVLHHNLHDCVPFNFVVRVLNGKRNQLLAYLREHNIGAGIHYPPNHLQPFLKNIQYRSLIRKWLPLKF